MKNAYLCLERSTRSTPFSLESQKTEGLADSIVAYIR